ncbi:703_t:CDS:2 [Acaulospora morrowiae]|uniref:703_t:CDS:1 n=1 Tax=Acaulospora morrowiae TaxID=94023 RepID=A0A9N9B2V5_9GLOM|nr:703_t:CDS:2 [Acaulospora morrowiae]
MYEVDTYLASRERSPVKPNTYSLKGRVQDNISYKLFINICYHLPPSDLFRLACVCKRFNNLLDENVLPLSSEIWRLSRERLTPFDAMKCPPGMTEFQFARLLCFQNGCQICKNKKITVTIYWIARVRACMDCIFKKAKSRQFLLKGNYGFTDRILSVVPPLVPSPDDEIDKNFYWMTHAISAKIKYINMNKRKFKRWAENLKNENFFEFQQAIQYHELVKKVWNEKIHERELELKNTIQEVCSEVGTLCQIPLSLNLMRNIRVNPFIVPDWSSYRKKLIKIVSQDTFNSTSSVDNVNSKSPVKKSLQDFMREDICKKLRNHTYYQQPDDRKSKPFLNIEDNFFKYIRMCPSYKDPPLDPRFPNPVRKYSYSEDFWRTKLLPTLLDEAEKLHSSGINSPQCIFDLSALEGMVTQCPLFRCQLCEDDFPCIGFRKMKKHMSKIHKIFGESEKIKMIKIDKAKMIDHLHFVFSLREQLF